MRMFSTEGSKGLVEKKKKKPCTCKKNLGRWWTEGDLGFGSWEVLPGGSKVMYSCAYSMRLLGE